MKTAYLMISAIMFGLVAVGHGTRVVSNWSIHVAEWTVPMWMSWIALFLAAALCVWAIALTSREEGDRTPIAR